MSSVRLDLSQMDIKLMEMFGTLQKYIDSVKNKVYTCVICNKNFMGYGNNPYPLKNNGRCCGNCNGKVIVERLKNNLDKEETALNKGW